MRRSGLAGEGSPGSVEKLAQRLGRDGVVRAVVRGRCGEGRENGRIHVRGMLGILACAVHDSGEAQVGHGLLLASAGEAPCIPPLCAWADAIGLQQEPA